MALRLRQAVRQAPMQIAAQLHIPEWLDHSVREAGQNAKGPLFIASPYATKLHDIAAATYRPAPDHLARLGLSGPHANAPSAPPVSGPPPGIEKIVRGISST